MGQGHALASGEIETGVAGSACAIGECLAVGDCQNTHALGSQGVALFAARTLHLGIEVKAVGVLVDAQFLAD